jgi:hypothetical protein
MKERRLTLEEIARTKRILSALQLDGTNPAVDNSKESTDIKEEPERKRKWIPWAVGGVFLLLLVIGVILYFRNK